MNQEVLNTPIVIGDSAGQTSRVASFGPAAFAIGGALLLAAARLNFGGERFISDGGLMMLALASYLIAAVFYLTNFYAPFRLAERHLVLDAPLEAPVPDGYEEAIFGLGCFWGAEEVFWKVPGVWSTSVGYAGGHTPNPTYEEVCSGRTGHTEAVRVVYDPAQVAYADLVRVFF